MILSSVHQTGRPADAGFVAMSAGLEIAICPESVAA
jgi:hypothetical protein